MRQSIRSCASAFSLSVIVAACGRDRGAAGDAQAAQVQGAQAQEAQAQEAQAQDAQAPSELTAYATAAPIGGKSVGHTSLVFKLKLEGGLEAAYKPRSRKALGAYRYKGEIAAYRIARALGLRNVPPAIPRGFDSKSVRAALAGGNGAAAWDESALPDESGTIRGALIPWIPNLKLSDIDHEPALSAWRAWLSTDAPVPEGSAKLAAQISTMLVFDYLTSNWDRWSGGNIGFDEPSGTLLFIDNDGAFYETPSVANLSAQLARIQTVRRFSKSFVAALHAFDAPALAAAVGDETPGVPLISAKILAATDARRLRVLAAIDAEIARDGERARPFD